MKNKKVKPKFSVVFNPTEKRSAPRWCLCFRLGGVQWRALLYFTWGVRCEIPKFIPKTNRISWKTKKWKPNFLWFLYLHFVHSLRVGVLFRKQQWEIESEEFVQKSMVWMSVVSGKFYSTTKIYWWVTPDLLRVLGGFHFISFFIFLSLVRAGNGGWWVGSRTKVRSVRACAQCAHPYTRTLFFVLL